MYYIDRLLLRSQILVASNQYTKLWDASPVDTKQTHFRFSWVHWRVLFRKAWLRDRFSTCLNFVTLLRFFQFSFACSSGKFPSEVALHYEAASSYNILVNCNFTLWMPPSTHPSARHSPGITRPLGTPDTMHHLAVKCGAGSYYIPKILWDTTAFLTVLLPGIYVRYAIH